MKPSEVLLTMILVGVFMVLFNVMKEVAESGPTIHKAVTSLVANSNGGSL